jgi:hypothetical protein
LPRILTEISQPKRKSAIRAYTGLFQKPWGKIMRKIFLFSGVAIRPVFETLDRRGEAAIVLSWSGQRPGESGARTSLYERNFTFNRGKEIPLKRPSRGVKATIVITENIV